MKKLVLGLFAIALIFAIQMNIRTTKSGKDFRLNQMIQEAEACFESSTGWYDCCYAPNYWCYIGSGYEVSPYWLQA